jgi:hypothetical protein
MKIGMETIQSFSIKRIVLLMQKSLYENAKYVLIGISTVFGIFTVILFFDSLNGGEAWGNMQNFYVVGFIISGLIISGMAFSNLRSKEKTMAYLSLPASLLEKVISELILTTIGFIIMYTLIFYVYNFIIYIIGAPFNLHANILNIFNREVFEGYLLYIILQSVLLAGAATFRKAPLFFTLFSLFVAGTALLIIIVLIALSFKGYLESSGLENLHFDNDDFFKGKNPETHPLVIIPKYLFYYVTAPLFWVVAYFKLKEKEV